MKFRVRNFVTKHSLLMFSPRDSSLCVVDVTSKPPLPLLVSCRSGTVHNHAYICLYIVLLIKPVAIVLANERSHLPLMPCSSPVSRSTTSSVWRRDGRAGVRVHDGGAYVGGGAEGATAVGADAHDTR